MTVLLGATRSQTRLLALLQTTALRVMLVDTVLKEALTHSAVATVPQGDTLTAPQQLDLQKLIARCVMLGGMEDQAVRQVSAVGTVLLVVTRWQIVPLVQREQTALLALLARHVQLVTMLLVAIQRVITYTVGRMSMSARMRALLALPVPSALRAPLSPRNAARAPTPPTPAASCAPHVPRASTRARWARRRARTARLDTIARRALRRRCRAQAAPARTNRSQ